MSRGTIYQRLPAPCWTHIRYKWLKGMKTQIKTSLTSDTLKEHDTSPEILSFVTDEQAVFNVE